MTALTVWKFNTPEGADQALTKLESLSKQELVTIDWGADVPDLTRRAKADVRWTAPLVRPIDGSDPRRHGFQPNRKIMAYLRKKAGPAEK